MRLSPAIRDKQKWLVYDEAKIVKDTKCLPFLIVDQKLLVGALYKLQTNLAFSRSTVTSAMKALFDIKSNELALKVDYKDEWVETFTRRFMNLCRSVAQGLAKSSPWTADLDLTKPTANTGIGKIEYLYGFDDELKKAWRSHKNRKDVAERMEIPDGAKDHDQVIAHWSDGHLWKVPDVTVLEYRGWMSQSRKAVPEVFEYYVGEHCVSKHKLVVKPRTDRKALICLFEQGRQILQCSVERFATTEHPDKAEKLAADFMVKIAERYSKDDLKITDLKNTRDAGLPAIRKRPAAASCSTTLTSAKRKATKTKGSGKRKAKEQKCDSDEEQQKCDSDEEQQSGMYEEMEAEAEQEEEQEEEAADNEATEEEEEAEPSKALQPERVKKSQPRVVRKKPSGSTPLLLQRPAAHVALEATRQYMAMPALPDMTSMLDGMGW